ncbi:ABC-type tungstate transport system, permease component TupA [Peptoclostridium acidaminophilum DSM 3953]|uniref:Tungstate-binding protein TupA n=2 Tax=Peptoclostridium acidaminophilum TaxID=1731 RepID=TUPA_PEPAC|nr:substrate-binding domain-containing protein [Peptoclostridium acidaminophilum]Q93KD6.1 RecName: Full=Tungstate-binding protein TupA; Flags: Precursor [Peptoclostridium acidaminophilum]AHM55741.1 ABC-type tungstate transport system, permease component TupA [Peptoclostridium acidaminophilum DSM 3953]CAC40782.1 extracellular tungstate binding protein [Peptoclostridium acidaminophilum]
MKRLLSIITAVMMLALALTGCAAKQSPEGEVEKTQAKGSIILATTTSTSDSGLLDYLLPEFTKDTGIEAKVVAVGTGQALQMGKDGEADVLLVHSKAAEEEFVAAGDGLERKDVMYNDFILVGPANDPLKLKQELPNDIVGALKKISEQKFKFISRGDDSGTHKKELALWTEVGITPEGDYYVSAGRGMGDVLKMADEMQAYTIADRGTYLSMKADLGLDIIVEKDTNLFNQYGVIPVNPDKNENINAEGAKAFEEWILSEKAQSLIGEYGKEKYGAPLFTPNAAK